MATLRVDGESLTVHLSWLEKFGALRGDLRVPLSSVTSMTAVVDPRRQLRGFRAPGTGGPGIALGTWRWKRYRDFVAVYGNEHGVVIGLSSELFSRIILSAKDPGEVIARVDQARRRRTFVSLTGLPIVMTPVPPSPSSQARMHQCLLDTGARRPDGAAMNARNPISDRLGARIARQFAPSVASELLRELSNVSFPLAERQEPERLLAAVAIVADGDEQRFRSAIELGMRDWRDLLVAAGLAHADWPNRLDQELGPRASD